MKKFIFSLFALSAITSICFAGTDITYKVSIERQENGTFVPFNVSRISASEYSRSEQSLLKSSFEVVEVNSNYGAFESKLSEFRTGTIVSVQPSPNDNVSLKLEILEREFPIAKGNYEFKLEAGKTIELPAGGNMRLVVHRES